MGSGLGSGSEKMVPEPVPVSSRMPTEIHTSPFTHRKGKYHAVCVFLPKKLHRKTGIKPSMLLMEKLCEGDHYSRMSFGSTEKLRSCLVAEVEKKFYLKNALSCKLNTIQKRVFLKKILPPAFTE